MRPLLLLLFCVLETFCFGQKTTDVNKNDVSGVSSNFLLVVGGQPFMRTKFLKLVEGSPYFKDEWMKGNVVLTKEKIYSGVYLKLDLIDNEVHYQDIKGEELITTAPLQQIILFDTVLQQSFEFVHSSVINADAQTDKGWYQKLAAGNAGLYKKYNKTLKEIQPYSSATTEQRITTSIQYYIQYKSIFKKVRKLKEVIDLLNDKKDLLQQYIQENKLKDRNEEDYILLINYYNSLADGFQA